MSDADLRTLLRRLDGSPPTIDVEDIRSAAHRRRRRRRAAQRVGVAFVVLITVAASVSLATILADDSDLEAPRPASEVASNGRALLDAVRADDAQRVRELLLLGSAIDQRSPTGMTPLMIASLRGNQEIAALLVAGGADTSRPGPGRFTPLHLAVRHRHSRVAMDLLAAGADIESRTGQGALTPLLFAVDNDDHEMSRLLLLEGANANAADSLGRSVLHQAVLNGSLDTVDLLVRAGADPRADRCQCGLTPLALAERLGHADIVAVLGRG